MQGDYDDLPPSSPVVWAFWEKDSIANSVYLSAKVWFNARREAMRLLECEATELKWRRVMRRPLPESIKIHPVKE